MTAMNRGWRAVRGRWGRLAAGLLVLAGLVAFGPIVPASAAIPARAQGPWDGKPVQSTYIAPYSLRVDLLSLNRPGPQAVVATFRITNAGSVDRHLGLVLGTQDDVGAAAGFALLDAGAMKAYLPLYAGDGKCVCSLFGTNLEAGQTRDVFVWLPAPPPDVRRISVLVPNAPPLLDVSIGSSTAAVPAPRGQPSRDPAALTLRPARVQQLVAVTDAPDASSTVEEDAKEKRVRLSSDVLFAINKAVLTPKALRILRTVAEEIERSGATVVHVDGHTDTTGGDAINIPLSKRRAASVRDALERMVDRDVRFDATGHGSAQPVAPNTTKEGRRLNRRVTVSFGTGAG